MVLLGAGFVVLSFYLTIHEMGWSFFGNGPTPSSDIYAWLYKLIENGIVLWIGFVMIAVGLGIEFRLPGKPDDQDSVSGLIPDDSATDDMAGDPSISRLADLAFKAFLLIDVVAAGLLLYDVIPMTYSVFSQGLQPNLWFYVYSMTYGLSVLAFSIFIHRNADFL